MTAKVMKCKVSTNSYPEVTVRLSYPDKFLYITYVILVHNDLRDIVNYFNEHSFVGVDTDYANVLDYHLVQIEADKEISEVRIEKL